MSSSYPLLYEDPVQLGDFRLVSRLVSGGMGTVYLGRSPRGRTVALKTMRADFAARTDFRARFRLEIDAARVIGGQYGAQVVAADPLAESPWLATEYVLGPQLDDAVALCGPFPEEATRVLGASLCDALGLLHDSGVVHRDLKPSNVLLTATGPKVIDFGIARAAGDERLTRTGAAAGTPAFMSPEQASGVEHPPGGDVFALAGVLVFACTGHGPFGSGQPADLLYRVRYAEPDLSGVPTALAFVLERCLAKSVEDRPGTAVLAAELRDDCGEFVDCLPDAAHAEILRRATDAWDTPPSRLPAPGADPYADSHATARTGWSRRRVLALSGGGVLAAAGGGIWTQLGSGQSGADDGAVGSAGGGPPKELWKSRLPDQTTYPSPTLVGRYVLVVTDDGLTVFDAKSGRRTGDNDRIIMPGDLVSGEGRVYTVDPEVNGICEVDPRSGQFGAAVPHPHSFGLSDVSLRAEAQGALVVRGTQKGGKKRDTRLAFDVRSGKERWHHTVSSGTSADDSSVFPVGNVLLVLNKTDVDGVDMRSGKRKWTRELPPRLDSPLGGIAHTDTHLYLGPGLPEVVAIRVSDGAVAWRFGKNRKYAKGLDSTENRFTAPVVKDGVLYTLERGNGIVALDAASGELKWEAKVTWADDDVSHPPVVGEKYLYFPTEKTRWVTAVDLKRRKEAWTYQGPSNDGNARLLAHRATRRLLVCGLGYALALPLE